jgi:hypothetical protein
VGVPDIVATLLIRFILTPLGVLGVHEIAALSVSEQVFVSVYSMLIIAVDIDTVWEFDPFTEVSVPDMVQDNAASIVIVPLTEVDTVALLKFRVSKAVME